MSTMTTELASLREDLRTGREQTDAARDRTQVLERELAGPPRGHAHGPANGGRGA